MLSLRDVNFRLLVLEAQKRGISVQELLRAVIIPEWVRNNPRLGEVSSENDGSSEKVLQPVEPATLASLR
jgi:hypothetical protein